MKLQDKWQSKPPVELSFEELVSRANRGDGEGIVEQTEEEVANSFRILGRLLEHLVEKNIITLEDAVSIAQPYVRYTLCEENT